MQYKYSKQQEDNVKKLNVNEIFLVVLKLVKKNETILKVLFFKLFNTHKIKKVEVYEMKKIKKILGIGLVIILCVMVFVGCTGKEQFPSKQITIVVPYSPGGASDMTARIFAAELEKVVEKPVIVSNKTGASGSIGLEFVKNSDPDGYTIAFMPVESTMINALGFTDLTTDDFKFIGRAMTIPAAVTVRKDSPFNTLQELLDYAVANPGELKTGNSGTGSIWHVAAAQLEQACGAKFTHVPFEGGAPAVAALLGENIDLVTVSPSEVKSAVDGGELKILAVLGDKRSSSFPDIQTASEQGIDVVVQAWGGFAVPKDTPDDVVKSLDEFSEKALNTTALKDFLKERGFEHSYLDGSDMDEVAKSELEMFSKLIEKLGIKQ